MKMEQHQIFTHFEFQHEKWAVQLELDYTHERPELIIKVVDTASFKVYGININVDNLAARGDLKFMFPALQELFYYLAHNCKALKITQTSIEFDVKVESAIKKKSFAIELLKQQVKKQDSNQIKIKMLQQRMEKQLRQKDQQISLLKREVQNLSNKLVELHKGGSTIKKSLIQPHPQNPDNGEFIYSQGANGLKIKRVRQSKWVNFISSEPIRERTTFKIQIIKMINRCLCLGVGTKYMFGIHNYHEIYFPNYDFDFSQIAVDGRKTDAKSFINAGTILTLRCDPLAFRIWWFCDSHQIGSAVFPESIRNKELYLIAYFKNNGDEIEVWK